MFQPLRWAFAHMSDALDLPGDASVSRTALSYEVNGRTLPARRFDPPAAEGPLLVFLHGGGWMVGGPEAHAGLLDQLALATGRAILSIGYAPAPAKPIIAAFTQVAALVEQLLEEAPLVLVGESAGGAMAATLAQRFAGHPNLLGQVLICPITDLSRADPAVRDASLEGWLLHHGVGLLQPVWFNNQDDEPALLSPLGRPIPPETCPALILTAGQDPLHMDGVAYAEALRLAGVPVTLETYGGVPHGFFTLGMLFIESRVAIRRIGTWLADAPA
jgi:acetyl esterase